MTGPLLYLTGEYPRATDTFIQREVAALRAQGITVMTASIRAARSFGGHDSDLRVAVEGEARGEAHWQALHD